MFCNKCGTEVANQASICEHCGASIKVQTPQVFSQTPEKGIGFLGVLCFFIPVLGLILFIVWSGTKRKKAMGAGITALIGVGFFILMAIVTALAVPRYLRYVEKSRSTEAQTAISTLREAFAVYQQTSGSTEAYSIDQALIDARLDESTLRNWKFEVVGNPPKRFIATSTQDFAGGEGKQLWYETSDSKFHGYGIDSWTNPDSGGTEESSTW